MTDDEIIAKAEAIKDQRLRAQRGNDIMHADKIEIVVWSNMQNLHIDRLTISPSAELAALLCKELDVDQISKPEETKKD